MNKDINESLIIKRKKGKFQSPNFKIKIQNKEESKKFK